MASVNPYRYAGYRYDENTKFYYLMARYYNPETGVFLSIDPLRGDIMNPMSQNGYNYANNNPVMMIDPTGTYAIILVPAVVAAIAVIAAYAYSQAIINTARWAYNAGVKFRNNRNDVSKWLSPYRIEHIKQRHFPDYPSTIGKGDLFPKVWSKSFIFSQITKIANMKMLPEFKDKRFSNRAHKFFPIIKSGFAAVIKVVFDRYTGEIITGYPLNGVVKLR